MLQRQNPDLAPKGNSILKCVSSRTYVKTIKELLEGKGPRMH